jgi:branched-chain amino acid transport system permease protein
MPPWKAAGWDRRVKWMLFAAALIVYPHIAPQFWVANIGAYALVLGIITLSLTFLAAYGGMVSLAQMTVAGIAGYILAILSPHAANIGSAIPPWPLALFAALSGGTLGGLLIGLVAVRTQGISLLMITLAIGMIFFYLTQQNTTLLHGFDGFRGVKAPAVFGVSLREPLVFYYLCLGAGAALYAAVCYLVRTPFGLALQGIRDNPRRLAALGFWAGLHQVSVFGVAGFIAAVGGVLSLWYNGGISPGSIGVTAMVNILIIAVIGGLGHPRGAMIGALLFVLIQNFATDLVSRDRFNTLIGMTFLVIVLGSPDGLIGLWESIRRNRLSRSKPAPAGASD